jgi:uncharacterized protein (DUF1800 family)
MKKRVAGVSVLLAACALGCSAATVHPARLTQQQKALHVLDRFTFGPTPGQVDAVARMGWRKWFAEQLHPETIADTQLDERLMQYPSLELTPPELLAELPSNLIIRQIALGRAPYSQDWQVAGMEQVLVRKFQQKKLGGKRPNKKDTSPDAPMMLQEHPVAAQGSPGVDATMGTAALRTQAQQLAEQVLSAPADERMADIMRLPVDERAVLAEAVYGHDRMALLQGFTPREREIFVAMGRGPNATVVADNELQQAEIVRAILSQRQLQEVMTEFWFNHFNVYMRKGADQWYTPSYVRDVIRPYALGKFGNLLVATAQSPAMLFYLDNWQSIGPDSPAAERMDRRNHQPHGINENYGREVMELHTVGVEGGYTQADVIALAKILTGWTIDRPMLGGPAMYMPQRHEPGRIEWYGHRVQDTGYAEGRAALLWLAAQPSTAHHICYELAQWFVADNPPPALVQAMAATYLRTGGNIRQILWTMVNSPEFWTPGNLHNKVKTPLEFVASAFRATGTKPSNPPALTFVLRQMGEPLFECLPPNGYPLTGDAWMNTGALVARMNFAMRFAGGVQGGRKMHLAALLDEGQNTAVGDGKEEPAGFSGENSAAELRTLELALLGRRASAKTGGVIERQMEKMAGANPEQRLRVMTALLLGSPEFQMH